MLLFVAILALLVTLLSWGVHTVWSLRLALCYPPRATPPDDPAQPWPEVAVLLPVRGADPVLRDCLRGLCRQDYPSFEVRIVVDSADDSAWPAIREVLSEFPAARVTTVVLTERLPGCSLKVSALLQGSEGLDDSCEVVAQIDADVVPPPGWLRELARPFRDPQVGAASGLRWYHTHSTAWGSLVRGLWGAGAAVQMYNLGILWGGSLAYRASLLRDPALRELWARCFVEDTSVVRHLRRRGLKLRILPRLTMINPEAISLGGCFRFIRRQVLCVRLHHPAWPWVLFLTLGMALSAPLAVGAAVACWLEGADWLAWTVLGTLVAAVLGTGLPLVWIDGYFYYTAPEDEPLATLHPKHIPVVPLTIVLQLAALISACRLRTIDWRGVRYAIGGRDSVRRLDYAPYTDSPARPEHAESIV
jgi:glycosyltransferase involved in cell wall biosynthesis